MNGRTELEILRDGLLEWRIHSEILAKLKETAPDSDEVKELDKFVQFVFQNVMLRYQRALMVIGRIPDSNKRRVLISYYLSQNDTLSPRTWKEVSEELGRDAYYLKKIGMSAVRAYGRFSAIIDREAEEASKSR